MMTDEGLSPVAPRMWHHLSHVSALKERPNLS